MRTPIIAAPSARIPKHVCLLIAVYGVASLVHFAHNAEFLADYPNLPQWLTRAKVYLAWLAITSVGAVGIALLQRRWRIAGLVLIGIYAALGFAGLDHYWVASPAAHSFAMNATIGFEVAAAAVLLMAVIVQLGRSTRRK